MFRGSSGNKPPLLPIGSERAIRLRTAETLNPNLRRIVGDGSPNSSGLAPEWGDPFQTYFKARKLSFVQPLADEMDERDEAGPSRPSRSEEKQKQRSSSSSDELTLQPEQQAGPIYQAPQTAARSQDAKQTAPEERPMQTIYAGKAAQPSQQQRRSSDAAGMPPVREEDEVPLNFAGSEPQSPEAPLEYTNAILYNDLVTIQQRSCKIAQYIREALPTHKQRQLFQQEIIGQHLLAERNICELLEVRHKAIQDQKQYQEDHPKQKKHQDQSQSQDPNHAQYRTQSHGRASDTFGRFKKGCCLTAKSTPVRGLMRGSPPGSLLSGSVQDSSSGVLPASSSEALPLPRSSSETLPRPLPASGTETVDRSSLWSLSGSSTGAGQRPWGLPPALQGSLFSSPPCGPPGSPFEYPQGDVHGSAEGLKQGSSQGSLNAARLATISGSPGGLSQGSSQGTLQGPASAAATPVPTPHGSLEGAPQQSPPQGSTLDGKAIAPWYQNFIEGAAAPVKAPCGTAPQTLMYQEPSQWPPIGASARNTSRGSSTSAQLTGAHRASSSTSVGPHTWPLVGASSRAQSRAPPRNTSRGPQRRSRRSTSRAHRQPHPSVVLGCTPWAHVKAAAGPNGPAKFHAPGEHSRFHNIEKHADGQRFKHHSNSHNHHNLHSHQSHSNHQVPHTKRIYGGVPKTEPSSRMYTAAHPSDSPSRIQMLEDQQLDIAMSKLSMPHVRHYSAMQKHRQSTKKPSQSGRHSEPGRSPDTHTKPKGTN